MKRIAKFYKNAPILESVEGLPRTVLGIVEHVLGKVVGRLG